jgi:O-antigen ligase
MKNLLTRIRPDQKYLHVSLIGLAILVGINYFNIALTGAILLALASLTLWPKLQQGLPIPQGALSRWALVWLLWLIVLVWISPTPYTSWFYFWTLAGLPVALLSWQLIDQPDELWPKLRTALWVGATIFAGWGLWQVIGQNALRAHGPLIDPNAYAAVINLLWFPLAARLLTLDWRHSPRYASALHLALLLLLGLAFFAANSRGAMLSWLLTAPLLLWLYRRAPQFRSKATVLLGLWVLAFLLMFFITQYNLTLAAANALNDDTASARILLWQSTWQMIQARPWLGGGLGTWSLYYPALRSSVEWGTTGYYAHNDYLQFAAEGGVLTLALFVLGLLFAARLLWRLSHKSAQTPQQFEAMGLLLGVMAISLHAMVNFIFYHAFVNILAGLFFGRAWQVLAGESRLRIMSMPALPSGTRKLLAALVIVIAGGQLLLHAVASLLNCNHPAINTLHRAYPAITEYELARFIHAIRPTEPIPQNLVLRYMAEGVDEAGLFGKKMQQDVLLETLAAYDAARLQMSNRTQLGAEEANLLITHRNLLPGNEALARAEKVALETLKLDPRHAESIIALADVQFAAGNKNVGLNVLARAIPHIFRIRDRRLLEVVYVQHLIAPVSDPELTKMENALKKVMPYTVDGNSGEDPALYDRVDAYLRKVMQQVRARGSANSLPAERLSP